MQGTAVYFCSSVPLVRRCRARRGRGPGVTARRRKGAVAAVVRHRRRHGSAADEVHGRLVGDALFGCLQQNLLLPPVAAVVCVDACSYKKNEVEDTWAMHYSLGSMEAWQYGGDAWDLPKHGEKTSACLERHPIPVELAVFDQVTLIQPPRGMENQASIDPERKPGQQLHGHVRPWMYTPSLPRTCRDELGQIPDDQEARDGNGKVDEVRNPVEVVQVLDRRVNRHADHRCGEDDAEQPDCGLRQVPAGPCVRRRLGLGERGVTGAWRHREHCK